MIDIMEKRLKFIPVECKQRGSRKSELYIEQFPPIFKTLVEVWGILVISFNITCIF